MEHIVEKEEKNKPAHFALRCTQEQKEFFQKVIADSGRSGAEFVFDAFETFRAKSGSDPELSEELTESDILLDRLSKLIRSRMYFVSEKERQLEAEHRVLSQRKSEIEFENNNKSKILEEQYADKLLALQSEFDLKVNDLKNKQQKEIEQHELQYLDLKEITESLESKLNQKEKDHTDLQKQLSNSIKFSESTEERNFELKSRSQSLEKENQELRKFQEKSTQLELLLTELRHKMELQKLESRLENERLLSEFSYKEQLLIQKYENRVFNTQTSIEGVGLNSASIVTVKV